MVIARLKAAEMAKALPVWPPTVIFAGKWKAYEANPSMAPPQTSMYPARPFTQLL
jgi:hypothetical protein